MVMMGDLTCTHAIFYSSWGKQVLAVDSILQKRNVPGWLYLCELSGEYLVLSDRKRSLPYPFATLEITSRQARTIRKRVRYWAKSYCFRNPNSAFTRGFFRGNLETIAEDVVRSHRASIDHFKQFLWLLDGRTERDDLAAVRSMQRIVG